MRSKNKIMRDATDYGSTELELQIEVLLDIRTLLNKLLKKIKWVKKN